MLWNEGENLTRHYKRLLACWHIMGHETTSASRQSSCATQQATHCGHDGKQSTFHDKGRCKLTEHRMPGARSNSNDGKRYKNMSKFTGDANTEDDRDEMD